MLQSPLILLEGKSAFSSLVTHRSRIKVVLLLIIQFSCAREHVLGFLVLSSIIKRARFLVHLHWIFSFFRCTHDNHSTICYYSTMLTHLGFPIPNHKP